MEWMRKMLKRIQHYRQLTQWQRYQIRVLHDNGFSQRKIADSIGVNHSTVSRELKRNKACKSYCAQTAHTLKDKRKRLSRKYAKYHEQHAKILYAALLMGWSPEKLSLRMKLEMPKLRLSHTILYRRVATDKTQGGSLYTKLPRVGKSRFMGGKRNRGRTLISNRVDIIQRPQIVAERSRIGDWEGDTVHGKKLIW